MNAIQASLQKVFIECLESMLKPIIRLNLYCGLGHSEFAAAVRRAFIDVASKEYGVRGRPANIAKISAKTGLPRKAIHKYRKQQEAADWTPDDEISPLNTIIHYWRFDERFCSSPGVARELPYQGDNGFTSLVRSCIGDIPASTIRQQLIREGIATQSADGSLTLCRDYAFPDRIDEDFLRNAAFSIKHLGDTLLSNAILVGSGKGTALGHEREGRFERIVWSRRLDEEGVASLQTWVREHGAQFVETTDEYISRLERGEPDFSATSTQVAGMGIFFFREG